MADAFSISRAGVTKVEGMHRRATLTDLATAFDVGGAAASLRGAVDVVWTADIEEF